MDLASKLGEFSKRIESLKGSIITEEATKTSLVMPFFQLLGYDVFNPKEFCPEYVADVGIKKGEKVDYAIHIDGNPVILVECKSLGEDLDKHVSQLFRYFTVSKAKFGILTNGLEYKFYTDLDEVNKMDLTPFISVNIENLSDSDIINLSKFEKDSFKVEKVYGYAEELKYGEEIRNTLKSELCDPSDDFLKLILRKAFKDKEKGFRVSRFIPLARKELSEFLKSFGIEDDTPKIEKSDNSVNGKSNAMIEKVLSRVGEIGNDIEINRKPDRVCLVVGVRNFAEMYPRTDGVRLLLYKVLPDNMKGVYDGGVLSNSNGLWCRRVPDEYNWALSDEFKLSDESQIDFLMKFLTKSYASKKGEISTTEEELTAFYMIRGILSEIVPEDDIEYKDTQVYFKVLYKEKDVCRLYFNGKGKYMKVLTKEGKFKNKSIGKLDDIFKYKDDLKEAVRVCVKGV